MKTKNKITLLTFFLVFSILMSSVYAGDEWLVFRTTEDVQNSIGRSGSGTLLGSCSQITANSTKVVDTVSLFYTYTLGVLSDDMTVSIMDDASGLPSDTLLGSASYNVTQVSDFPAVDNWMNFTLVTPVTIGKGELFWVCLGSDDSDGGVDQFRGFAYTNNGFGGQTYYGVAPPFLGMTGGQNYELIYELYASDLNISNPDTYYNFEQTGSTLDDIFGLFDVNDFQVTDKTKIGISGSAWELDRTNNDYIKLDEVLVDDKQEFTINLWYNPNSLRVEGHSDYILFGEDSSSHDSSIDIDDGTGTIRCAWDNNFDTFGSKIQTDSWYMLTYKFNSSHVTCYMNGTQETQRATGGVLFDLTQNFYLGSQDGGDTGDTDGSFDEFSFFEEALTDDEILSLYLGGGYFFEELVVSDTSLLSYGEISTWTFDDANTSGVTSYDWTGHADGTIEAGVLTGQAGLMGESYYFTLNDDVDVGAGWDVALPNNFTICAWLDYDSATSGWWFGQEGSDQSSWEGRGATDPNWKWNFEQNDGHPASGGYHTINTPQPQEWDGWQFVCGMRNADADEQYVYVNGLFNKSNQGDAFSGSAPPSSSALVIGDLGRATGNGMTGYIDQVSIWSRTLSASEIWRMFNDGAGLPREQWDAVSYGDFTYTSNSDSYDSRLWANPTHVDNNFGAESFIIIGEDSNDKMRGLINFTNDVCGLVPDWTDVNVDLFELQFYIYSVTGTLAQDLHIYPMNKSWTEGTLSESAGDVSWNEANTGDPWTNGGEDSASLDVTRDLVVAFDSLDNAKFINVTLEGDYIEELCRGETTFDKGIYITSPDNTGTKRWHIRSGDHITESERWKVYMTTSEVTDADAPVITVDTINNLESYNDVPVYINMTVTDETGVDTCVLNDTTWSLIDSSAEFFAFADLTNATDGLYSIDITCNDTLGNGGSENIEFYVDRLTPQVISTSPLEDNTTSEYSEGTFDVDISTDDNIMIHNYTAEIRKKSDSTVMWTYVNYSIMLIVYDFERTLDVSSWENTTYIYDNTVCNGVNCKHEVYEFELINPIAPELELFNPVSLAIDVATGEVVEFDVEVTDDNSIDSHTYSWIVDGTEVATTEDYDLTVSKLLTQTYNVTIITTDDSPSQLIDREEWLLTVTSGHSATYTSDDFLPILVDGMGTAGATVVGFIGLISVVLLIGWGVKRFKFKK